MKGQVEITGSHRPVSVQIQCSQSDRTNACGFGQNVRESLLRVISANAELGGVATVNTCTLLQHVNWLATRSIASPLS